MSRPSGRPPFTYKLFMLREGGHPTIKTVRGMHALASEMEMSHSHANNLMRGIYVEPLIRHQTMKLSGGTAWIVVELMVAKEVAA